MKSVITILAATAVVCVQTIAGTSANGPRGNPPGRTNAPPVINTNSVSKPPGRPGPEHPPVVSTNRPSPLAAYDENADGTVSSNELAAASLSLAQGAQAKFLAEYDADKDNHVASDEAMTVHEAIAERWLTNLIARIDRNSDGTISSNEVWRATHGRDHIADAKLDANSDGTVSPAEFAAAAQAMAEDLQKRLLNRFDVDKNFTITPAESLAVYQAVANDKMEEILEKFDLNNDGEISSSEIQTVLQPRPQRKPPGRR